MFKAKICVTLRPSILDPQGKATQHALHDLGFDAIEQVRMGKYIEIWVEASSEEKAREIVEQSCGKLLANPVMEDFSYTLEPAQALA